MSDYVQALAELVVRFGANVQPDQIVAISSEPGKEHLARAIAEEAYRAGARFVDLSAFDIHLKRARALYADPDTLSFVPPWYGQRILALGEARAARIVLAGPVAPRIMEGIDPALAGRDMLPSLRESVEVVNARTTNWTIAPCPTPGWAEFVYPDLGADAALKTLWEEIAHVCRLDEPDPVAAWRERLDRLVAVSERLGALDLDALRFEGPGTDLTVGLFQSSRFMCASFETADGTSHVPNLPTEEVFTTPDPERVDGVVRSTKPLFASGQLITGLVVRFDGGRAVQIDADQGADTLRGLSQRDAGAAGLGEVALVDREGRIGPLGTVFYDTLLDENAASHVALGNAYAFSAGDDDSRRLNQSGIHIDFMVGSPELEVTGVTHDGTRVPVMREGAWRL